MSNLTRHRWVMRHLIRSPSTTNVRGCVCVCVCIGVYACAQSTSGTFLLQSVDTARPDCGVNKATSCVTSTKCPGNVIDKASQTFPIHPYDEVDLDMLHSSWVSHRPDLAQLDGSHQTPPWGSKVYSELKIMTLQGKKKSLFNQELLMRLRRNFPPSLTTFPKKKKKL